MSEDHTEHVKGGYFKKGCEKCAMFIGKYLMSGRKFRKEKRLRA